MFKTLTEEYVGEEQFEKAKRKVRNSIKNATSEKMAVKTMMDHFMQATQVTETNTYLMTQMTSEEFEMLLHPAFQEDEWILILVGGVLGAIVGFGQAFVLGG